MRLKVVIASETLLVLSSRGVKSVGSDQEEQGIQSFFPDAESVVGAQQHGAKQEQHPNQESAGGYTRTNTHTGMTELSFHYV